jgi:hypothetical protein
LRLTVRLEVGGAASGESLIAVYGPDMSVPGSLRNSEFQISEI